MSRIALSDSGDWQLEFPDDQDVRGYRAVDKDGTSVGVVDAMIVNTEEERVDAVVLEDGTEYPAADISIGDGVVYLTSVDTGDVDGEVRVYGDSGRVLRRETVVDGAFDDHVEAFQAHAGTAYTSAAYEDYEPAYRYGFESAHADENRNRSYFDAQDDLKSGYTSTYADRDYDTDSAAVRYGYTRAQHLTR
ncbi:PRC-barrel domain-containing protein [Rubrivirga sp.]|uniref:PRC-barrel domain-containing protein n=1 Tax=Rubrivirga sp. TaxID=1885344 RepID=UPI003C7671F2